MNEFIVLKEPVVFITTDETHEWEEPIVVTLSWYCGCDVGTPTWQNLGSYEWDECPGEGRIAVPFSDLEFEDGALVTGPDCYCTECHQVLVEPDHFEGIEEAIKHNARISKVRKEREEARKKGTSP